MERVAPVHRIKSLFVIALALGAGIYLMNPTMGVFELLPDNLPGVGNIDEAAATLVIVNAFRYFGFDITALFRREELSARRQETDKR